MAIAINCAARALAFAVLMWSVVFVVTSQMLRSSNTDMNVLLASCFGVISFAGFFYSEWKRSAIAGR